MRWHTFVGLLLLALSGYISYDLWQDSRNPWPAYAQPQAECGLALGTKHDGAALRFQYPQGWTVFEKIDRSAEIVQTYLLPVDGAPHELILFFRDVQARFSAIEVPEPLKAPLGLKDAPAEAIKPWAKQGAAEPLKVEGTEQTLAFGEDRNGNAYLTRTDEGRKVSFSWIAFVWDKEGRSVVASGPQLIHSNWPHKRKRDRHLNCAFWGVLKTVEAK